ncbi:diguanylate cyclase [Caminibacter pacificus]|uniref:diguanylate cyclase n=1 Tax=Caminibacter pacificus TaxID=1424653 RepID=A0AAJ4RDY1_9BACT|nr:diguanylate cyclase [Caminibacter pacificus]QCI28289.1 diguanylate cyclase [Caminibacter pacificus]ROR40997.1 diguanylate cyclase (GGDEF)-like protein [Caminibacter pacificus]
MINRYLKNLICLYVEDDEMIRDIFALMLKRYFKEVIIATNGKEGLELFKTRKPDIIISDIRMPIMDGIEMARDIKKIDPSAYIIFVTAFSDSEYLQSALELGAEGYITKPVEKEKLLQKLNFLAEVIKNKRENEELTNALKVIFENQTEATALYIDKKLKLANKKFKFLLGQLSLEELIEKLNIKLNEKKQIVKYDDKILKIKIIKFNHNSILIFINDITKYEEKIQKDPLTGVYNRNILEKILKENINKNICVIFADIDHFKKINDTYGHQFGDTVLQTFAQILKNSLRKNDIIVRYGGEEFLIYIQNVESIKYAQKIAEQLRKVVENFDFNGKKITASFGVCCKYISSKESFEELIKNADKALYKAKNNGRNRVEVCE